MLNAVSSKLVKKCQIVGIKETTKTTCTGVEMFRKPLTKVAGENVGVLLRGTKRDDVERGQVLAKPGTLTRTPNSNQKYTFCQRRRRSSHPFFKGYRPQFYFRTTDVTGTIELPKA